MSADRQATSTQHDAVVLARLQPGNAPLQKVYANQFDTTVDPQLKRGAVFLARLHIGHISLLEANANCQSPTEEKGCKPLNAGLEVPQRCSTEAVL